MRHTGSVAMAERGPYTAYLKTDSLKGKRFGVPAFILQGAGVPFQGIPAAAPASWSQPIGQPLASRCSPRRERPS